MYIEGIPLQTVKSLKAIYAYYKAFYTSYHRNRLQYHISNNEIIDYTRVLKAHITTNVKEATIAPILYLEANH